MTICNKFTNSNDLASLINNMLSQDLEKYDLPTASIELYKHIFECEAHSKAFMYILSMTEGGITENMQMYNKNIKYLNIIANIGDKKLKIGGTVN